MLARERPPELEHEIGDFVRDHLELPDAVGCLQVHDRANVQAADRRVGIDAGSGAMLAHDCEELFDEAAQALRSDGGVLNERDALRVSLHRHGESER